MGMTKPIADNHTSTDDFTPMTRSSDAQVADDHEKAIQCPQYVFGGYNSICTYR